MLNRGREYGARHAWGVRWLAGVSSWVGRAVGVGIRSLGGPEGTRSDLAIGVVAREPLDRQKLKRYLRLSEGSTFTADDAGVGQTFREGSARVIPWDQLQSVELWVCRRCFRRKYVLMTFQGGGAAEWLGVQPNETALDLMVYLARLPGFDIDGLGKALAVTPPRRLRTGRWICWRRDG